MNSKLTRLPGLRKAAPTALLLSLLTACGGGGGGSDVGDQNDAKPIAVAQAIGSSSTVTGTVPARSGSDILLTGKESDGIDDPIFVFQWRQVDNSGVNVELIERTRSTKLITVPQVAQATDLQFELTVIDSDNVTASDTVTVRAVPAPDANVFLEQDAAVDTGPNQYQLVVGVEPGETTNSNFSLDVETVVEWLDRTGNRQSLLLGTRRIEGTWPDGVTGVEDIASAAFNPRYLFSLPEVDLDEINKRFEAPGDRDKRVELRDVDEAEVFVRFALDRFDNNARLVLLFNDDSTREIVNTALGQTDSGPISGDQLKTWAGQQSGATAGNYYALIDAPPTLSQWLQASGFGANPRSQEGVAHAIYLNNFDLGFGRDMYLRVDEQCGNVYSYVGNYPNLDNAIQNLNNFATVVMEYSPLDNGCGDDKIVKFMAYVPDETSGEQVLVNSMNFDGRGEKFVPGVCTVCHGGHANDLSGLDPDTIAALGDAERLALADLNSSFMLWDLDSFLFADTDPAITADRAIISDAERERFSRAAQEEDFKAMNQGALHTYLANPERHAPSLELVHGWYGREDCARTGPDIEPQLTPGAAFDGSFVQCGWRAETQLYEDAFARYCRACHTQFDALDHADTDFDNAAEFLDNAELDGVIFRKGTMPLARLTYDRFWSAFDGGTRAVDALGAVRNITPTATGLPVPLISAQPAMPDGGDQVVLDGSASAFADSFSWALDANAGCPEGVPALLGADTVAASFTAGPSGCRYTATLTATNVTGSASASEMVNVRDPAPETVNFTAPLNGFAPGDDTLRVEIFSRITEVGDGGLQLVLGDDGAEPNPNAFDNGDGSFDYLPPDPFGLTDTVQYQLRDANGTPADTPGVVTIDIPRVLPLVTATGSPSQVVLNITLPAGVPVDGYMIERGDSAETLAPLTTINDDQTATFTDTAVITETTYFYRVTAFLGELMSDPSSLVQVRTIVNPLTGVSATAESAVAIRVSWNPVADAVGYLIQDGGGEFIANAGANDTSFLDTGLTPETTYNYRVLADFGGGVFSDPVTAQATTPKLNAPASVTLTKDCNDPNQIDVAWDLVPEAQSYLVSYSGGASGSQSENTSPATITGLPTRAAITVQVRAVVGDKQSDPTADNVTTCVSWSQDIYASWFLPPNSPINCASGGCHDGTFSPPIPAGTPTVNSLHGIFAPFVQDGVSCFLTDTCSSGMSGAVTRFLDAGGVEWVNQDPGAANN